MYSNILNTEELLELCQQNHAHKFVKIIAYDLKKRPKEELQGICTGGSVNIDGKSVVRRSCSLTFIAKDQHLHDAYWSLTTQFQLFVGLQNDKNNEIVWFPLGWFLISSFSYSQSLNNCTISISGKDKMALLNGEMGGTFSTLSVNLSVKDIYDSEGHIVKTEYLTLKQIIYNLVSIYGNIPQEDIIITGLDGYGKELLEYRGDAPMYLLKNINNKTSNAIILDPETLVYIGSGSTKEAVKISDQSRINYEVVGDVINKIVPTTIYPTNDGEAEGHTIIKIEYGNTIGYKLIEKIYGNDLIANLNDNIVSILNKIISYLSNKYEYYFNIDGQFVFQPKVYAGPISAGQVKLGTNSDLIFTPSVSNIDYTFLNHQLMTNFSNKENILDIKNDFAIWGSRNDIPIYLRYAINQKPKTYTSYHYIPSDEEKSNNPQSVERPSVTYYSEATTNNDLYDWRELIYQMAYDHSLYGQRSDYLIQLTEKNNWINNLGKTGYENYYVDMLSFWRDIYNPNPEAQYNEISVASINADEYDLSDVFIDQINILDNNSIASINNRSNIYTIYNNQLQRWIDTVNFLTLKDNAEYGSNYNIDNMYYFDGSLRKKIIDSLTEWTKNETFYIYDEAKIEDPAGPYIPYYNTINDDIKDKTYITLTKTSKNYLKLIDYFSILTYEMENIKDDTTSSHFYLRTEKNGSLQQVEEFWLKLSDEETACIWKHDNQKEHLSTETINVITEAVKNFALQLYYCCNGTDLIQYDYANSIYVVAEREFNDNCEFYYKENATDVNYQLLSSVLLHYQDDTKNANYSKYNVFYKKTIDGEDRYIQSVDLIKVDKSLINIENGNEQYSALSLVMDSIDLPDCSGANKFYTFNKINKINIKDLEMVQYNQILPLYLNDSTYATQFISEQLNLVGTVLQYGGNQKQTNIKYYERYFNYALKTYDNTLTAYDYTGCWKNDILSDFNKSHFWLDFLAYENYDVGQYAIPLIGHRQKNIQNNSIKGISFQDNLKIVFGTSQTELNKAIEQDISSEYIYVLISDKILSYFVRSSQSISCLDVLNQLLVENLNMFNSISFNLVPMFFLQENDIIWLNADQQRENGSYQINRININLSNNSLMQIQANKIIV